MKLPDGKTLGSRAGFLEEPFLLPKRAERANVCDREGEAKLIFTAVSETESAVLHAEATAIRVVGDLPGGGDRAGRAEVVPVVKCRAPSGLERIFPGQRRQQLVGRRGE